MWFIICMIHPVFLLMANYLIYFLVKSGLDRVIAYHLVYSAIYLSDLNKFLCEHCEGLKLLAESEDEMQKSLNTLHEYCEE